MCLLAGSQNGNVKNFADWHTQAAAVAGMRERLPAQTIDRVTEAIEFAAAKHGDQQRPTAVPYLEHLLEALQVLGQINEQQVQQMMKLRELMMADMSSKQAYQASVIQREAAGEAASERFFTSAPVVGDGKKYSVP